jgi:hypothetical protein
MFNVSTKEVVVQQQTGIPHMTPAGTSFTLKFGTIGLRGKQFLLFSAGWSRSRRLACRTSVALSNPA